MKKHERESTPENGGLNRRRVIETAILGLCILAIVVLYRPRRSEQRVPLSFVTTDRSLPATLIAPQIDGARLRASGEPRRSLEEIVAHKVIQFGADRRKIVTAIAAKYGEAIPEEVERFFDALDAGNWEETDRLFQLMAKRSGQYKNSEQADPRLNHFWPAVLETYGVAEQAHDWPADELLKYGEDVLGSLRSGTVYIGGSDPGRFIPTLLSATSGGEQHAVLTQNALADSRYLEYIQFLYGDRLQLPGESDSQQVFADYMADAQKRLEHDEKFPDEPKQVRHGEELKRVDGKLTVGGHTAVMDINERLLNLLLEKNPDTTFALQESIPLKSTYAEAKPVGAIMELRARADSPELAAGEASEALNYWRNTAAEVSAGKAADPALMAYSHMAVAHGNLLAHHGYNTEAEETYRLSMQMFPRSVDTIIKYSEFLEKNRRAEEARALVDRFVREHADLKGELTKWLPEAQQPFLIGTPN